MENIENPNSSNEELEVNDSEIVEDGAPEKEVPTEEGETPEEKIAKLEETNKKLFARAKKAEEDNRALKQSSKEPVQKVSPQLSDEDLDKKLEEKLNERDLASMDLSDELKSEVKTYAKAKGVSLREASNSGYIKYMKSEEDKKSRELDASASSKNKGKKAIRDFGKLSEDEIDNLSTEEFEAYKNFLKTQ